MAEYMGPPSYARNSLRSDARDGRNYDSRFRYLRYGGVLSHASRSSLLWYGSVRVRHIRSVKVSKVRMMRKRSIRRGDGSNEPQRQLDDRQWDGSPIDST